MYPPPPFGVEGGHTRWGERWVGGQYFGRRQTQLCTLRMYRKYFVLTTTGMQQTEKSETMLRFHEIMVQIRMRIRIRRSIPLTNGSGFGSGCGPDPAIFVSNLQDVN